MKINIQTDGVIITSKQKSMMEKKLLKMKRYLKEEPMNIDLILRDDTGPEKGGVDQKVHINATWGKEQIFIEETDDRLMRAFAYAIKRFERQLNRYHKKMIEESQKGGGRFEKLKIWKKIKRRKSNKKD